MNKSFRGSKIIQPQKTISKHIDPEGIRTLVQYLKMYIAVDIGGTKTEIGFFKSKDLHSLVHTSLFPTSQKYEETKNNMVSEIKKNVKDLTKIKSVIISFPGVLSKDGEGVLQPSNIPDYTGKPLQNELKKTLASNVFVVQDSTCSGVAELIYGQVKDYSRIAHLIMGTGLGGTFIEVNGNKTMVSPIEPGGIIVNTENGRAHKFNKTKGIWEAYVGGGNVEDFYEINLADLKDDDKLWDEVTDYLAVGINNIACVLKPEIVVIGGGIGLKRRKALGSVIEKVKAYKEFVEPPVVKFTDVEGNSSLIGALAVNFVDNLTLNT